MNLKFWIAGVILTFIGTFCYGQKSSDNVSNAICRCIEEKVPKIADVSNLKDSVNACFAQGMATDMGGLRNEYKMKSDGITVEQIREVRDKLWRKLEKNCESFKKVVAEL